MATRRRPSQPLSAANPYLERWKGSVEGSSNGTPKRKTGTAAIARFGLSRKTVNSIGRCRIDHIVGLLISRRVIGVVGC